MGFPSPAMDYIERRLDLNDILMPHRNNMMLVHTPDGFVLVDRSLTPAPGDTAAFQLGDYEFNDSPLLGKLFNTGMITQDGETIDGEGLEGGCVLRKVTAEIVSVYEPLRPTI